MDLGFSGSKAVVTGGSGVEASHRGNPQAAKEPAWP
jgi:hypothetical protein